LTSLFNLIRVRKSITTKLFDLQRLNIFHLNTYEHLISESIVLRELELANADVDAVNGVENLILERSVPLRVENIIESNCAHIFVPKAERAERILFGVTVFIQVLTLFFFTLVLRCDKFFIFYVFLYSILTLNLFLFRCYLIETSKRFGVF